MATIHALADRQGKPVQHFADELRHAANAEQVDPSAGIVRQPQFHKAALGRRRLFLSAGDAAAYDAGWRAYPSDDAFPIGTPFSQGFFDHEKNDTVHA